MTEAAHKYDNQVAADNVYGHTLELLRCHGARSGVHLDVGCGFGRIAEYVTRDLGLEYIGIDFYDPSLSSLRSRGFEAHQVDLLDRASLDQLPSVLKDKNIVSMSLLNVIEHIEDAHLILQCLHRLAKLHSALLVVSVPNVAHKDIGFKHAFGRWDYTDAGLLEDDHIRFFTNDYLQSVMANAGWHEVARKDTARAQTEQHFPHTHPILATGTSLHKVMSQLRAGIDAYGEVFQLVRAYLPGSPQPYVVRAAYPREIRPIFLSVIMRTQGRRLDTLRDALLCLTGQSSMNFEVLVIGHKVNLENQLKVERVIEDLPAQMRAVVTLHRIDTGQRSAPLNYGFSLAKGDYISIFDDDDLVLGHWVETFEKLAEQNQGQVLRAIAVRQNCEVVSPAHGKRAAKFTGSPVAYLPRFNLLEHLTTNHSPPICLAFPRGVFHDLGYRFSDELTTTEDWDFLMRVVLITGCASATEVTSIYRWWTEAASSRTVHKQAEWEANHALVLSRIDRSPAVLPPGTVGEIRRLVAWASGLSDELHKPWKVETNLPQDIRDLQDRLLRMLRSTSWKYTVPLRTIGRLFSKTSRRLKYDPSETNGDALRGKIRAVRRSLSWRITSPIRKLTGGRKYDKQ